MKNKIFIKKLSKALLIILLLFFWGERIFADNVDEILLKFGNYKFSVDYKGKLVTVFVNSAIPFVHKYEICNLPSATQREEKMAEGNKEVSFDDGKFLWRYLPYRNLVIQESSQLKRQKRADLKLQLASIKKNYNIEIQDKKKILHRNAYLVLFKPKREDRPKQLIWIDSSNGIPLRSEKYDSKGKLAIISSFSEIKIINKIDTPLNLKVPSNTNLTCVNEKSNITLDQVRKMITREIYVPEYLPFGFNMKNITLRKDSNESILQLFYSDGLVAFSIFQGKKKDKTLYKNPFDSSHNNRRVLYYTKGLLKVLDFNKGNTGISIVGEMFWDELKKVSESFTLYTSQKTN